MKTTSAIKRLSRRHRAGGFSLLEVLILVSVIGIVGAAAGRALQAVTDTPVRNDQMFQIETQLISKMEAIRALGFDNVALGTTTDTFPIGASPNPTNYIRTVTVVLGNPTASDPTQGTTDPNCKLINVSCAGQSVNTMITK